MFTTDKYCNELTAKLNPSKTEFLGAPQLDLGVDLKSRLKST